MNKLTSLYTALDAHPVAQAAVCVAALLALAWLANLATRRILLRIASRLMRATENQWDDAILARGVIHRIANIAPIIVLYIGSPLLPGLPDWVPTLVRNLSMAYIVLTLALALSALLSAANDVYQTSPRARSRPIKGYLQVGKILVFVVAAILIVAVLIDRSPILLLSGLGAMTAILLLVFKDTILSLVASVQVASNDMLRVGDWIEMPQFNADGDVIDIALHTVKVQNWDKTITTIPTHKLISDSFKNWRGMSESGGRRIKRALHLDQTSIRFLGADETAGVTRFALLADYLRDKRAEVDAWNTKLAEKGKEPVNTRRLTNAGTFRAYVLAYLQHHPSIRDDMTLLVRQLEPSPTGLPLEIYCFTDTTNWNEYERIQGDILDHLIAILPEFGLRLFQQPAGSDLAAMAAVAGRTSEPESESGADDGNENGNGNGNDATR